MKKINTIICIILLLFNLFLLCSCQKEDITIGKNKISIEDIKTKYTDEKILNIQKIKNNFVLIESQKDTFANKFTLYNLNTGESNFLPTSGNYVSVEKIIDENNINFLATGKNSESSNIEFPYLINCNRKDSTMEFSATIKKKILELTDSVEGGNKKQCQLSSILTTPNTIRVYFKPSQGKETEFFADSVTIPITNSKYIKEKNQMTFKIEDVQLAKEYEKSINKNDSFFITPIETNVQTNCIELVVTLKDFVDGYTIASNVAFENNTQIPYFEVEFLKLK